MLNMLFLKKEKEVEKTLMNLLMNALHAALTWNCDVHSHSLFVQTLVFFQKHPDFQNATNC